MSGDAPRGRTWAKEEPDDPEDLATKILTLFDESPAHWPDVEFTPRSGATGTPTVAGHGWRYRAPE